MAKVTKRDRFIEIATVLEQIEDTEALVEFIDGEIALLDKRAAKPRKPTADQIANEGLKDEIVEILGEADAGRTATEVAVALDVSVQKASQLLRQLVIAGRVTRVEGKGKTKTVFTV